MADDAPRADSGLPEGGMPDLTGGTVSPDVYKGLADIKRQEMRATEGAYGSMAGQLSADQKLVRQKFNEEGVKADEFRPWNEAEQSAKYKTDPIEAFGSLGSVFGLIASAFTNAPFENAMLASAAAIGAIKEGNDKAYERAYKAWQDNTKLALDRHKIQHEQYEDALQLMNANMAASQAKLRVLAARFGDKKALFLLENGMDKELLEMQAARQKLALGLAEAQPRIMLENMKMRDLMADPRFKQPDGSSEKVAAIEDWQKRWDSAAKAAAALEKEREQTHAFREKELAFRERQQTEIERRNKATEELGAAKLKPEQRILQQIIEEHPDADSTEIERLFNDALRNMPAAQKGGVLTGGRQDAAEVERRKAEYIAQGMDATAAFDKAKREVGMASSHITGNQRDQIMSRINRVDYSLETIDKVEALLKKHNAITGLGGTITRPAEAISNVFGSNETDRKQFERWINELQEWAPQILNDRSGRPLSAEAAKTQSIIAGLRAGDTKANTVRAFKELRELYRNRIRKDLQDRYEGTATSGEGGGSSRTTPAPADAPWKKAPIVEPAKRSDLRGLPQYAQADTETLSDAMPVSDMEVDRDPNSNNPMRWGLGSIKEDPSGIGEDALAITESTRHKLEFLSTDLRRKTADNIKNADRRSKDPNLSKEDRESWAKLRDDMRELLIEGIKAGGGRWSY